MWHEGHEWPKLSAGQSPTGGHRSRRAEASHLIQIPAVLKCAFQPCKSEERSNMCQCIITMSYIKNYSAMLLLNRIYRRSRSNSRAYREYHSGAKSSKPCQTLKRSHDDLEHQLDSR